jgi:hypothetical protein
VSALPIRHVVTGLLVALSLVLSGAAYSPAAELTFSLAISHGRVPDNMRLIRVKEGDAVRLRVTTDAPVVLHVHGYDIEQYVTPGAAAEISFTARATGRFPIHAHAREQAAGDQANDDAALADLEVYPR